MDLTEHFRTEEQPSHPELQSHTYRLVKLHQLVQNTDNRSEHNYDIYSF